jgi:hypothetical protein
LFGLTRLTREIQDGWPGGESYISLESFFFPNELLFEIRATNHNPRISILTSLTPLPPLYTPRRRPLCPAATAEGSALAATARLRPAFCAHAHRGARGPCASPRATVCRPPHPCAVRAAIRPSAAPCAARAVGRRWRRRCWFFKMLSNKLKKRFNILKNINKI